jgi:hypothetical protein
MRIEMWVRLADSCLYLSSLVNGSPSDAALKARTSRLTYPDTDKGAQAPLFSQHGSARW